VLLFQFEVILSGCAFTVMFHASSVKGFSCLYAIDFRAKVNLKFRTPKLKSRSCSNFT